MHLKVLLKFKIIKLISEQRCKETYAICIIWFYIHTKEEEHLGIIRVRNLPLLKTLFSIVHCHQSNFCQRVETPLAILTLEQKMIPRNISDRIFLLSLNFSKVFFICFILTHGVMINWRKSNYVSMFVIFFFLFGYFLAIFCISLINHCISTIACISIIYIPIKTKCKKINVVLPPFEINNLLILEKKRYAKKILYDDFDQILLLYLINENENEK